MITKEIALDVRHGRILHHKLCGNADGTPVSEIVNGVCKAWKTRPTEYRLPVKHGLRNCFYITPVNAGEWELS